MSDNVVLIEWDELGRPIPIIKNVAAIKDEDFIHISPKSKMWRGFHGS